MWIQWQRIVEALLPPTNNRPVRRRRHTPPRIEIIEIRQHAALRPPRRAGRVEQAGFRLQPRDTGCRRRHGRPRHHLGQRQRIDHRQRRRHPRPYGPTPTRSRSSTRCDSTTASTASDCAHLIEHLVVAVVRVDRHDADAERVERQIVLEELRPAVQQQRHAMPMPVSGRGITPLQALDARRHLGK